MFIDAASGLISNDGAYLNQNGSASGQIGEVLHAVKMEPGLLRPFLLNGRPHVCIPSGKYRYNEKLKKDMPIYVDMPVSMLQARNIYSPAFNQTALTKEAWIHLDENIVRATRQPLTAWADMASMNTISGFDALAKWTYEYMSVTDPGIAVSSMDGLMDGPADAPKFRLRSLPLPITNSDFSFPLRQVLTSRAGGLPLDTFMGETCGRRIGELTERRTIGTFTDLEYGGQSAGPGAHDTTNSNESRVYGWATWPFRVTKIDLNTPIGTNPEAVKQDIIEMRETMYTNGFRGPFMLYYTTGYDAFFDDDYFRTGSTAIHRTLRERIGEIADIVGMKRLDFLTTGFQMFLIQMTSDLGGAVIGMPIQVVQWESRPLMVNFKVWCCMVPLLRAPYNGIGAIVHGTTS